MVRLDAIYVSTPRVSALRPGHRGCGAGGFMSSCDKPMAMNAGECQRMIDACQANGVHLQICFLFRFHSCFQQIKKWVAEGRLGGIVQGRGAVPKTISNSTGSMAR